MIICLICLGMSFLFTADCVPHKQTRGTCMAEVEKRTLVKGIHALRLLPVSIKLHAPFVYKWADLL